MNNLDQIKMAYKNQENIRDKVERTNVDSINEEDQQGFKQIIIWLKECVELNKSNPEMVVESKFVMQCTHHRIIFTSFTDNEECCIKKIKYLETPRHS